MRLNVLANFLLVGCCLSTNASAAVPFSFRLVPYAALLGIAVQLFQAELPLKAELRREPSR